MNKRYSIREGLAPFIPEAAIDNVLGLVQDLVVEIKITNPRSSVYGNYHTPHRYGRHIITINSDLNKYAFLITLIHEFAHLYTIASYGRDAASHGQEWKYCFKKLMNPLMEKGIFPDDVTVALENYFLKTPASTSRDHHLLKILDKYGNRNITNQQNNSLVYIDELSVGALFIHNNNIFVRGQKLRKNIRCIAQATGIQYVFNPIVKVKPIVELVN